MRSCALFLVALMRLATIAGQVEPVDVNVEQVLGNDVLVHYRFAGLRQAGSKRVVCVSLEKEETKELLLRDQCFAVTDVPAPESLVLKLSNLLEGKSRLILTEEGHSGEKAYVGLEVQKEAEMRPSYEWQLLSAWHTIPSGVETRLPLDGVGHKECRIPQPWQLQLPMPHPCRHFLRINLLATTQVRKILSAAAEQCQMPEHCFALAPSSSQDSVTFDSTASVERIDLFNAPHPQLRVLDNCS